MKQIDHDFQDKHNDKEVPRYQIDIHGLDAFRNFTSMVKNTIQMMINCSKNAIFMNHS